MMDNLLDFVSELPMIPLCRSVLLVAAVLMLAGLWLIRRKRKIPAAILALLGLALGIGAGMQLATRKEPQFSEKYLAATNYYDRIAMERLAEIIQQQYPAHQVVALLPADAKADTPDSRVGMLASGLGPQAKVTAVRLAPDDHALDELMELYKKLHPQMTRPMVQSYMYLYVNDWYRGRHYVQSIAATGLSGKIVVVAFAGLPQVGIAEVKEAGYPVLLPPGTAKPETAGLVEDGTVAAAILSQPGSNSEIRQFHNPQKAFARRWFLLNQTTLPQARKTPGLLPQPEEDEASPAASN